MNDRQGFVMLSSYYEAIRTLEDSHRLALYDAIMAYVFDDREPQGMQGPAQGMFSLIKPNIDSSLRHYEARKRNGQKGGRPSKQKPSQNQAETKPEPNPKPKREPSGKRDKDKDKDKDMDKEYKDSRVAPETGSPPAVITLPLNDRSEYEVQEGQVKEWEALYPAVDVLQELRNMRGWLLANPEKRKTRRGVLRFVTAWLAREQDKGGTHGEVSNSGGNPGQTTGWGLSVTQL